MKKEKIYCPYCATKIESREIDGKIRDYCAGCKTIFYENPLPVACAIVVNEKRQVLLVKRAKDPYKDMWCLPIGFAESGEMVRDAALRELKEETGVDGEIVRLIDVDTVDNYFYGSLAIVTYEVRMTGGSVRPGDDASDAGFFPIQNLPPLAWTSNDKAIKIYFDIYHDTWSMIDSFSQLFPEANIPDTMRNDHDHRNFLSSMLIQVIERDLDSISKKWEEELTKSLPGLLVHLGILSELNISALRGIQYWLRRERDTLGIEEFIDIGAHLKKSNIPLPDVLSAMALSRKSLWVIVAGKGIFVSPLQIYTALEMNNRIIFFYDKINYYLTRGYFL